MFPLICITITAIHLTHPYSASDKFSCTEPDKDAESFLQLTEAATLWDQTKTNFITGFSEGQNKFRHRWGVEHCWPDDMNGIPNTQQNEERATQKRRQKQRFMDCSPRGLKPKYSQLKAEKLLMEHPNATWNDFSTNNVQEDVMLQVCLNFLHDVKQIKIELATMRQEMRNLRTELQELLVNCMAGNSRPWAPSQKGKQKTARFCNCCHKNGHTPKWCRKKYETKKYEKYKMKCSPKGIMFLTRTMALMLSTAAANTIKMWTDLLTRMMATTQLTNITLPKKKPVKMNLTKSLHLNANPFQGPVA